MVDNVSFTGLSLDTRDLLVNRKKSAPFPASWTRIQITGAKTDEFQITNWLIENTEGKFGLVSSYPKVSIFFEDEIDAVFFKMKDGDKILR